MTIKATFGAARAADYQRPGGAWDIPPLIELLHAAEGRPDAFVDGKVAVSTDELFGRAARVAGGLERAGVERSDAVAWQLPNGIDAVVLYLACWHLGAVAVAVHDRAGIADVQRIVDATAPAVMIANDDAPLARHARTTVDQLGHGEPVVPRSRIDDVACVLFTAGSSGTPKGVLHTHRTLGYKARQMPAVHGLDARDSVLMPAPMGHVSGLLNGILVPLAAGMRSVPMARWDPDEALTLIEQQQITFMVGPPTFFVGLMHAERFTAKRVASLRLISTGGAGVTEAFADEASERLGALVKRTFGSTEAPTVATSSVGDDPILARVADGHAIGAVELLVTDPADGMPRHHDTEGELWVRGPELFAGYLDPLENAGALTDEGWFRTGDLAKIDAGGWLRITGRLKDVIIRGGENISVSAVEEALEAHPRVRHAVVMGEADERLGERVVAFVEADASFDLAVSQAWFAGRGIAKISWPERVVVMDEIPKLPAGKPDRVAVRARLTGL